MPALTLTLADQTVAYNLLTLIRAVAGYVNTHPSCRELTLLGDPGNGGGFVYKGGGDVSALNYGERLQAGQSYTFRSDRNDISLADIWVIGSANNVVLHADWMVQ